MNAPHWLSLLTCAGMLALGVVCILRLRVSTLAAPLSLLCLLCFVVRFSGWAQTVSGGSGWPYFVRPVYPWIPAVALHFVLSFVGLRKPLRGLLRAAQSAAAALSVLALLGFAWPALRRLASSEAFQAGLALEMFACAGAAVWLLLRHLRAHDDVAEKLRTKIMLALAALGLTLPLVPFLLPGSQLLIAAIMLLALVLLTTVTFGFQLLETELSGLAAVYAAALLVMALAGYVVASRLWVSRWPFAALLAGAIAVCMVALLSQVGHALMQQHTRTLQLAALGRFSTNMAHDLKNPLAALKGAAQFLLEEHARGRSLDGHVPMVELLLSESNRLSALVDRYQHFGGLSAVKEPTSLNQLAERSLQLFRSAAPASVVLQAELSGSLPECALDPQLVLTALENVLTNAIEAMPDGGSITMSTSLRPRARERASTAGRAARLGASRTRFDAPKASASVLVSVEDTGRGMTPRELAQVFDEPFSSKAEWRGLGLPLVKRAVEAHGGTVQVYSRLGQGTRVDMSFPVA